MSKWQHYVLIGALSLVFLAGLFPPVLRVHVHTGDNYYSANGRTFLPYPTAVTTWSESRALGGNVYFYRYYGRIDYWRLVLEWITIATLAAAIILVLQPRPQKSCPGD